MTDNVAGGFDVPREEGRPPTRPRGGRTSPDRANAALRIQATGSPRSVGIQLRELVERHKPDELILTSQIHDHRKRLRSLEIAATCLDGMKLDQAA